MWNKLAKWSVRSSRIRPPRLVPGGEGVTVGGAAALGRLPWVSGAPGPARTARMLGLLFAALRTCMRFTWKNSF